MNRNKAFKCPYGCQPFTWLQAIRSNVSAACQHEGRDAMKHVSYIQCPICTRSVIQGENEWKKGTDVKYTFVDKVQKVVVQDKFDIDNPDGATVVVSEHEVNKFGKEVYFCEKCQKNHTVDSKIGRKHAVLHSG